MHRPSNARTIARETWPKNALAAAACSGLAKAYASSSVSSVEHFPSPFPIFGDGRRLVYGVHSKAGWKRQVVVSDLNNVVCEDATAFGYRALDLGYEQKM